MNHSKNLLYAAVALIAMVLLWGCSDDFSIGTPMGGDSINLLGEINQEYVSRANDDGFANGDQMGVYIVDYDGAQPGVLSASGNRANNAMFQFDAANLRWVSGTQFYWKDKETSIDVYGYYPYTSSITDINEYLFTVEADQSVLGGDGTMGSYEKSDFLWAKTVGVAPTSEVIKLNYQHRMAGVYVALQKGDGISDTEWEKVSKQVTVDNTIRLASIDMATGIVTANGSVDKNIVMCPQGNDVWRAVVVPQNIAVGTRLLGITIDGTSYNYTRTQALELQQGKLHRFTLKIDKKDSGDYTVSLVSESITPWENDNVTHGFFEYEYTVVRTTEPGTLKATIEAMGKNYQEIKNLKIIGPITESDFLFMRGEMSSLAMLNMKEAQLKGWTWYEWDQPREEPDNYIPGNAFYGKNTLRRVILPDCTERIGGNAFREIGLDANSSIIIPPHVKHIDEYAFAYTGEAGELVLNDKLEYVGARAFYGTRFTCNLTLPTTLRYIGGYSFGNYDGNATMKNTATHFQLPPNLEYLGEGAFANIIYDEVGEIIVPKFMTEIPYACFPGFTRGVYVTLHDGLKSITNGFAGARIINHLTIPEGVTALGGEGCFGWTQFCGGITLPSSLRRLSSRAFIGARGLGDVVLPEGITTISGSAFTCEANSIVLPSTVEVIEDNAFCECSAQMIKINKNCSYIAHRAFRGMGQLRQFIVLNPEPPTLQDYSSDPNYQNPFGSLNFDQVVLEVPEKSVELYRNTPGWNQFRFITAYHELAVGTSELKCLDKGLTYETLVRAEGEWEVAECPSWCHVSPSSSEDRRTEVTITVDPATPGTAREGKIVYKLKNADYTTYTTVRQMAYDKAEDKEIVLQTASAGGNEIPVFLVGEGFDARDITDGTYIKTMNEAYEHLFAIEPYKTYKNYFTVSTAIAVSPDDGIETVTDIRHTKFGLSMDDFGMHFDFNRLKNYAKNVSSHITNANVGKSLIIVVPKYNAFLGMSQIDNDGTSMALCAYSTDTYPYDFRGVVQYHAGGAAFGRLGSENISHNTFLRACTCPGCSALGAFQAAKSKGWYGNLNLTSGMNSVPWKHLIFDPRYSDIVDVYEGGYNHLRGVFRSENMSCMSSYINYYNTISRELIVRRIMECAGKTFNFEDFVSKDSREGMPE